MREREIEQYFIRRVREAGGLQRKFVSPGHRGVPDQIAIFKGWVVFVELKAPEKVLRPDQKREMQKLRDAGCSTFLIQTKETVDNFIKIMEDCGRTK